MAPRTRRALNGAAAIAKRTAETVAVTAALASAVGWLLAPRATAWAQAQAQIVVDARIVQVEAGVRDAEAAAREAAGAAASAQALAQQQAAILGALACLQADGTIVPDGCAFRRPDGSLHVVGLKDATGLVAEMAVKR